jgi:hypothetical protein
VARVYGRTIKWFGSLRGRSRGEREREEREEEMRETVLVCLYGLPTGKVVDLPPDPRANWHVSTEDLGKTVKWFGSLREGMKEGEGEGGRGEAEEEEGETVLLCLSGLLGRGKRGVQELSPRISFENFSSLIFFSQKDF